MFDSKVGPLMSASFKLIPSCLLAASNTRRGLSGLFAFSTRK